jgi:hypothetical protein
MIERVQASGLRLGIGWGQSLKPYLHLNKKAFMYFERFIFQPWTM